MQQFNQPAEYPHNVYDWEKEGWQRALFGDISDQKYFIIYQIAFQIVAVFCLAGLICVFQSWKKVGKYLKF